MRYGRLYKGVVVTVAEPPLGHSIEKHVGPDEAEHYETIPAEVDVGWYQQTNGSWLNPEQYAAKKAKALHVQIP